MDRSQKEMQVKCGNCTDGQRVGTKSEKSYKKYSKQEPKLEKTSIFMDPGNVSRT
ncbi:MAG: hypothetical protein KJ770_05050 [Actinobacteria bacterium]|nr:hypothetical protein [Actinomycetota bacterium]